MFPLIKPVNIVKNHEQVLWEETYFFLIVYRQLEDRDEISKEIHIESTAEMGDWFDYDLSKEEDPYKREQALCAAKLKEKIKTLPPSAHDANLEMEPRHGFSDNWLLS